MNKKLLAVLGIVAVLMVGIWSINLQSSVSTAENKSDKKISDKRIVKVEGSASISAKPDVAYINIGVETLNKDVEKAQIENAGKINKVIEAITKVGVVKDDITTTNYNIRQSYDYSYSKRVFEGYKVSNDIRVKVKDTELAGKVIKVAVDAGTNKIRGISFDIEDKTKLYNKALKMAINNAEAKAKALMEEFGDAPNRPYRVIEVKNSSYYDDYDLKESRCDGDEGDSASPQIFSGNQTVTSKVIVEYDF